MKNLQLLLINSSIKKRRLTSCCRRTNQKFVELRKSSLRSISWCLWDSRMSKMNIPKLNLLFRSWTSTAWWKLQSLAKIGSGARFVHCDEDEELSIHLLLTLLFDYFLFSLFCLIDCFSLFILFLIFCMLGFGYWPNPQFCKYISLL